jgi:hypothetical protein
MADENLALAVKHMAQHIAERSNAPGPAEPSGAVALRMAAIKGMESGRTSDGNKQPNEDAPPAPSNKGRTKIQAAAKKKPEKNKAAKEPKPGYAGEPWVKAGEQARAAYRKAT